MTLNYAVIHGSIKCVLFDDRPDSKTCGCVEEYFLSPENYSLITVPPLVWNGWKGIGDETSIVANCATIPHDPSEIERKSATDPSIPYDWEIKHK
jgi:dTDP-4-dehydrorhamnose 3,5-epimerase